MASRKAKGADMSEENKQYIRSFVKQVERAIESLPEKLDAKTEDHIDEIQYRIYQMEKSLTSPKEKADGSE